ncbi:MAG: PD-(D/E)XK nuclease family protein [Vicinamibacterales bacterium]
MRVTMYFLERLAASCSREPDRTKWVFVPGRALGHTLGERLAREFGSWMNVRWVTPLDIATRMAGPFLVEAGIEPSDETLGPALMMRLMLEQPVESGYFRPLAEQPSMATAVWQTVTELRLAGLGPDDLQPGTVAPEPKRVELQALLAANEDHLRNARVADAAAVFALACRHATFCPILATDYRVEWPEVIWPPLVRRLLDGLPGQADLVTPPAILRLTIPRRAVQTRPADPVPSPSAWHGLLAQTAAVPASRRPPLALDIFHAGGREAEVEEVCRRILASGAPLDEIEVSCGTEAQAWLVWEKTVRLDWAATVGSGVPAAMTRPGRALLGWCDWVEGEFAASRLRQLLLTGDVSPAAWSAGDSSDGALSAGQGARLLLRLGAAWGKGSYAAAFARTRVQRRSRLRSDELDDDRRTREAIAERRLDRLEAWIQTLLAAVPDADAEGTVTAHDVADAALAFLAANALRASMLDAAAFVAVEDSLTELRSLGAFRADRRLVLRLIRERVEGLRVGPDRARPGSLHISTLSSMGVAGRRRLFVVGLEEGRIFPTRIEDPVLLDVERGALHAGLRQSADRVDESVYAVVHRLVDAAGSAERVSLSFSCRDTREFRDSFPSWLLLQAFRLRQGEGTLTYRDLVAWLGEPASFVPRRSESAHTDVGWWLARARTYPSHTQQALLRAFPAIDRAQTALRHRAAPQFTAWDGYVPEAGALLDPSRDDRVVSASTLEGAAACPFRFFLRYGLGVVPIEENERDADVWLDPITRGRELHDLYAGIMRSIRAEGRSSCESDISSLIELGRARLHQLRTEMPPPSEDIFRAEQEEFLHDLQLFMEAERQRTDREPLAFEVTFGLPSGDSSIEPLSRGESVSIPLDEDRSLRIHGRIDRIDRIGDGTFETIDYKTGKYWAEGMRGTFAAGRRLQHALYAKAAEAMLISRWPGAAVTRNTYYFPTRRGLRIEHVIPTPSDRQLGGVLAQIVEVVRRGTFVQAQDSRDCQFCEFAAACDARPWEGVARKLGAEPLAAMRDLSAHE